MIGDQPRAFAPAWRRLWRTGANTPCPNPPHFPAAGRTRTHHAIADIGQCRLGIGDGGDMRRGDDLRMLPDRAASGSGSVWNTSSTAPARCPQSSAAIRSSSIRWPPRATLITQAPLGSLREKFGIQDAARVVGQRQHADQKIALRQEMRAVRLSPAKLFTPWMILRVRLQPDSRKVEIAQALGA